MHAVGRELFDILSGYFDQYGYWTLFLALLLENAGVPVPGETILLFASFLAFSEQQLRLPYIIVFGILAATLGDNLGYSIGRRGGRPLLDRYASLLRIPEQTIPKAERLFARYGNITVYVARFIFGMRIIAGPLAGVLRMPWGRFVLFNFLGAATWVTVISVLGYTFGEHWVELTKALGRLNLVLAVIAAYVGLLLWRRYKARRDSLQRASAQTPEQAKAAAEEHAQAGNQALRG
jgi:membrane-associated protein